MTSVNKKQLIDTAHLSASTLAAFTSRSVTVSKQNLNLNTNLSIKYLQLQSNAITVMYR